MQSTSCPTKNTNPLLYIQYPTIEPLHKQPTGTSPNTAKLAFILLYFVTPATERLLQAYLAILQAKYKDAYAHSLMFCFLLMDVSTNVFGQNEMARQVLHKYMREAMLTWHRLSLLQLVGINNLRPTQVT